MNADSLDALDHAILQIMRRRGRVRNKELAASIGLSQSACLERVRKLERCGYILGYAAILSEAARGGGFEAWVEISLSEVDHSCAERVSQWLREDARVLSADRVSGQGHWIVRFSGPESKAWKQFVFALEEMGLGPGAVRMSLILEEALAVTCVQDGVGVAPAK